MEYALMREKCCDKIIKWVIGFLSGMCTFASMQECILYSKDKDLRLTIKWEKQWYANDLTLQSIWNRYNV